MSHLNLRFRSTASRINISLFLLAFLFLPTFAQETALPCFNDIGFSHPFGGTESNQRIDSLLNTAKSVGKWLRVEIPWAAIQPDTSTFVWINDLINTDNVITKPYQKDLTLIVVINTTPSWARPEIFQNSLPYWEDTLKFAGPDSSAIGAFAHLCGRFAARYGSYVHYYEIWNEPNGLDFYRRTDSTADYALLLKAAADSIRASDPDSAYIITGGLVPIAHTNGNGEWISSHDWVDSLYHYSYPDTSQHSRDYFDFLGYHPYAPYDISAGFDTSLSWDPLYDYCDTLGNLNDDSHHPEALFLYTYDLHELMRDHFDGDKKIFGTEFGGLQYYHHMFEDKQAMRINHYISKWKSWDFVGPLLYFNVRDYPYDTTWVCGAFSETWNRRPVLDELQNWGTGKAVYHLGEDSTAFSYQKLSNAWIGKRLVAAATYFDTVRVFLHGDITYDGDACSFDLLNFADLPQDSPFRCLELIGVGPEFSDTTGHAILHGVSGSIKLRSDQTLILRNLTFQNCGSMSHSMFTTTGDVVMDNCSFIENSYPQGIIGWGDADLEDPEIRSTQLVKLNYCTFADNVVGSGADPLWLINCINGIIMNKCTFSDNSYPAGDVYLRQGAPQISNSIFLSHGDGSRSSIVNGYAEPEIDHCLFDQNTWAASYCCLSNGGNLIVDHDSSATQVTFVDPSQHDYRPRWNSIALDAGRQDSLDFDLTYQDIGWSPRYRVTEISGTVPLQQRGWYKVVGNTTLTGGTDPDLVIPDGTIILCDGAYEMVFRDTDIDNGYLITVGSSSGARTSLVSHGLGNLTFGSTTTAPLSTAVTTKGVLFNRGPDWCTGFGFVWFNTCDVDIDGQGGNTIFNDYDETCIYLDNDCGGTIHNIDFREVRQYLPTNGIGQICAFVSGLIIDNVTFDQVSNSECYFDCKVNIGFMNANAATNVISNCHFLDAEQDPGTSQILMYSSNNYLHHNVFDDVRDAAIDISCSTVKMNNIAENSFYKPFSNNNTFDNKPVVRSYLGSMDLNCGYNSFVVSRFDVPTKFVTASSGTTDWSSNFWGQACDEPRDPIGHIPTFVTNVSPTLPECPTAVFEDPCSSQQSPSALYNAARSAHTNGNYPAAISYWNELLLLYPNTLNSMEACNAMKTIGVWTEFGAETYSAIASMLDTIAVVSLPLNSSLSLHEFCNGLCVEGRHGDRQAVISSFDSLLVAFAGKKDELEDIQISKAEVLGYPLQGQSSALADPFATRAHRRLAIRNLLNVMAGRDEEATGTVLEAAVASQPATFQIRSVHPNPFNPITTLDLELSRESLLRVEVFNLLGQRVARVHDGPAPAGGIHLAIDGAGWASGVYFVRVQVDQQTETRKILLTR